MRSNLLHNRKSCEIYQIYQYLQWELVVFKKAQQKKNTEKLTKREVQKQREDTVATRC